MLVTITDIASVVWFCDEINVLSLSTYTHSCTCTSLLCSCEITGQSMTDRKFSTSIFTVRYFILLCYSIFCLHHMLAVLFCGHPAVKNLYCTLCLRKNDTRKNDTDVTYIQPTSTDFGNFWQRCC